MATRAGSTDTRSNTCASVRLTNVTSGPKSPRMASQVESRESGARTTMPASSAAAPKRLSTRSPLPPAPCKRTSSGGSGARGALAGTWRIASRLRSRPSARVPSADVVATARGRTVSRPSFGGDDSLSTEQASPSASDVKAPPAIAVKRRRVMGMPVMNRFASHGTCDVNSGLNVTGKF